MKYYIATRLENHARHNEVRDRVNALGGYELTYDWTTHGPVWQDGVERIRDVQLAELEGIRRADFVVVLLPGGRGTHVELGVALALRKDVVIWSETPEILQATKDTCAFYHNELCLPIVGPLPVVVVPIVTVLERRYR